MKASAMIRMHATLTLGLLTLVLSACAQTTPTPTPLTPLDYATAEINLSTPEHTAYSMMIAMYRGDTTMIDQVFTPDGVLRRLRASGEIDTDGLPRWRDWVGTLEVGQADEELLNLSVEQFDNLATVWAPFVIRFDGEIVGCGVNQFTMAKMEGDWRVVSGIDVQAPKEDCATFKEIYQRGS